MLTDRLKTIVSKINCGERVIDVGTDHAYIPIYLVQNKISDKVLGSDINQKPLESAKKNIERAGCADKIELVKANGLSGIDTREYDTVIIAGMGGTLISEILSTTDNKNLKFVLQPMTAVYDLRKYLYENGYNIVNEQLSLEGDKLYTVITAKKGIQAIYDDMDLYIGKCLVLNKDPLLKELILRQIKKFSVMANGLEKGGEFEKAAYYKDLIFKINKLNSEV